MSVVDRCARCSHTRGVHRPHCRLEAGCDCLGFVEAETQTVLSSPAGEPWWA